MQKMPIASTDKLVSIPVGLTLWKTIINLSIPGHTKSNSYKDEVEELSRLKIWQENIAYMEAHNVDAKQHDFILKLDKFSDLTNIHTHTCFSLNTFVKFYTEGKTGQVAIPQLFFLFHLDVSILPPVCPPAVLHQPV